MSVEIKLTRGRFAFVDENMAHLSNWKWQANSKMYKTEEEASEAYQRSLSALTAN